MRWGAVRFFLTERCAQMPAEQVRSNLVVTAHHFNPSVFSQLWLVRNQIVGEDDFASGCLFSDQAVNVETPEFGLLVFPPQLQFVPKVPLDCQQELVEEKVGRIVRTLPHPPCTSVGLNFVWHVKPEDGDVLVLTRGLFYEPQRRICQLFDTEDARYGAYFSKDILGCRLKLDVRPVIHQAEDEQHELLQFAFNFHLDLPQEGSDIIPAIERQLQIWDAARSEAARIVEETVVEKTAS